MAELKSSPGFDWSLATKSGLASISWKRSLPASNVTGAVPISYNHDYNSNHDSQN